ncbi:hypothetical protein PPACK8108_LOCUS17748 [Phakopsora pachyrhizi]|uniref:Uncharacterized protein n=1 Tax=Phakopsora pachyrhizi TaxID=170000 RepID=A0AAV0BD05_PHAPC|nr:hypothetical protein PPACK8108_LOCUS17748 [Phakopsora pachyrhizi]
MAGTLLLHQLLVDPTRATSVAPAFDEIAGRPQTPPPITLPAGMAAWSAASWTAFCDRQLQALREHFHQAVRVTGTTVLPAPNT